jgi:hypothetical protein
MNWKQLFHHHSRIFLRGQKQADTRCVSRVAPVLAKAGKAIDGGLNI